MQFPCYSDESHAYPLLCRFMSVPVFVPKKLIGCRRLSATTKLTNETLPFFSFPSIPSAFLHSAFFFFATDNIVNMQPLLFNTLQVRSALGQAGGPASGSGGNQRRKLSFRNVSNVVVQLLHSIKYSVEVPFSNIAAAPSVHSVYMQQQNPGSNGSYSGGSMAGHKKVRT